MTQQKYTIDDLKARKKAIRKQIRRRQQGIKQNYNALISPAQPAQNMLLGFAGNATRIYAFYTGIRTALRVYKAVKSLFALRRGRRA